METIDILESRIQETLSRKARLEEERRNLVDEVMLLHENIRRLETEKEEIKAKLEAVIEKIELYLSRSEA
ncbi:MAG TPA: hypothetical protein VI935_06350 [Thermodesulfobacteriota bacterium]|nr:hypothetical protein [Thermodesulfobacteriota bacterium]